MRKFENVEHTNPFELLFLFCSTVALFIGVIFLLNRIMTFSVLKGVIAITLSIVYFLFLKKKFIVKTTDFELTSNKLKWNNNSIDFKDITYYKIHWLKGAGIKFKFRNGKTLRLSSNDHFCNSDKFVNLCHDIDSRLVKYNNGQIKRKGSFFESKQGYYFAVIISILFLIGTIYKLFTDEKFNFTSITLILVSLLTVWNGITWNKK